MKHVILMQQVYLTISTLCKQLLSKRNRHIPIPLIIHH